jgi:hypothetical protein
VAGDPEHPHPARPVVAGSASLAGRIETGSSLSRRERIELATLVRLATTAHLATHPAGAIPTAWEPVRAQVARLLDAAGRRRQ